MIKLKTTLIGLILTVTQIVVAQTSEPFSYLDKIEIEMYKGTFLHLNSSEATIVNKKRSNLSKDDIFYAEECEGESMTLVAICKVDNSEQKYAIVYSTCPNPEFIIYDSSNPNKIIGTINSDHLYINGSGSLYSSGGEGTFDTRKKYTLNNDKLEHVQQPFYYVGLKSKTLNPVSIYQSKNLETKIASLPANYEIEVVFSEKAFNETEALYLVKTAFGLTGWAMLKAGQYKAIDVEGLIYKGD
jgi:hypothetical protein